MNNRNRNKKGIQQWRIIAGLLMLFDILAIHFSYFIGLWIRFDFSLKNIPEAYLEADLKFAPWQSLIGILIFWIVHMYHSVWRFVGFYELVRYLAASLAVSVIHCAAITVLFQRMPFSYYLVGSVGQAILIVGIRFSYRFYLTIKKDKSGGANDAAKKHVMVIGGGIAGHNVVREILQTDKIKAVPCCVIDDNQNKWGRYLEGIPITGGRDDILENVEKYQIDQIFLCIPSASAKEKRDILNICSETKCELKSLPGVYQLVNGEVLLSKMRPVAVEDLLGREPIQVNLDEILRIIMGKTILITGGGGSIGSELCRQVAGHNPKHLIIFDIYENNAYEIEQELRRKYPCLRLTVLIGSVRDSYRIFDVMQTYMPEIVYHAAAHKHVPLMETSPCEAIKNNVMGTYKTAYAAMMNGCQRFVLISTDKAVNPTNIMGASKRICEMVIQSMDRISKAGRYDLLLPIHHHDEGMEFSYDRDQEIKVKTEFVAVRFGNVLGSNGSVIPLFKKQIAEGGPVTVTHPDIIRYFMTIPEAVSLVLQAGTYAKGGEIFVLDMGEPVKIDTLARNLIKLSGYKPDEEIQIVYSGLRPGEKLYEEKLMEEEGMKTTPNKLIHIGNPIPFDVDAFLHQLSFLADAAYANRKDICLLVKEVVPTFQHVTNQQAVNEIIVDL